jgi:nitroreductase
MELMDAISNRRSIRKFINKDIDKNILINILNAGIYAPSPKNNQPWKFIVITNEGKHEMIKIIKAGFESIRQTYGLLIDSKNFLLSADHTIKIMEEAPVTIFVINTENKFLNRQTPVRKFFEMANILSIGAAVENMLLASLEYGIGGLWISDIHYIHQEIGEWLHTDRQIVAAGALGYPAESPPPGTRKEMSSLVEWK